MDKSIETFCDIPIFEYDGWDEIDVAYLQFYKVNWLLESMKKFNGRGVARTLNGALEIDEKSDYEIEEEITSFSINIIDIPEIRNMILARIPSEILNNLD